MDKFKAFFTNNWNSILKPVVVLLAICIVIPFALAATNLITHERIEKLEIKTQNQALALLFKDATFSEKSFDDGEKSYTYYEANDNDELIGYVFTASAKGYGGNDSVSVMTAINIDGTIKAIKILDVSSETPGLGQNAGKESFYSQFSGLKDEISINKNNADKAKNEITPITGATITSSAVKDAVNDALDRFAEVSVYPSETITDKEVPEDGK